MKNLTTTDAGKAFIAHCKQQTSQVLEELDDKLRGLNLDVDALKREISSGLIHRGKAKSELILSKEEIRLELFNALCTCSINGKYDQEQDPQVGVQGFLSARGEAQQIVEMDDDHLLMEVGKMTKQAEDALRLSCKDVKKPTSTMLEERQQYDWNITNYLMSFVARPAT